MQGVDDDNNRADVGNEDGMNTAEDIEREEQGAFSILSSFLLSLLTSFPIFSTPATLLLL